MSRSGTLGSSADEKCRFTASDSLVCKYWANSLGYISDPFIDVVFDKATKGSSAGLNLGRRSPIINRGYYARIESMSKILSLFLESTKHGKRQLLCLGSGLDTFSLLPYHRGHKNLQTFEVDFQDIITKKAEIYLTEPTISGLLLPEGDDAKHGMVSETILQVGPITLVAQDLRNVDLVISDLTSAGLDPSVPTFVLTECVLVYIQRDQVARLCERVGGLLHGSSVWATYDMINPDDMFGKTMNKNLKQHGFYVPGFAEYPTLEAQRQRFLDAGWSDCKSATMLSFFNRNIYDPLSEEEKKVLLRREIFDEFEEWNILMEHYSLSIAMKQGGGQEEEEQAVGAAAGEAKGAEAKGAEELFSALGAMFP